MPDCKYPQHHGQGHRGLGLLFVLVVAVLAYRARHFLAELVHWLVVVGLVAVAAAVVVLAIWLVIRRMGVRNREHKRSSELGARRARVPWLWHLPRALWAACTWRWVARNLTLAAPDRHRQGRVRRPKALIWPTAHGLAMRVRTTPGTGRLEIEQASQYLADHLRVQRVSVTQSRPGRIRISAVARDPLTQRLDASVLPAFDGRRVLLGRDDLAEMRLGDLANHAGSAFSGSPGRGKTEAALSLAVQLAASPLVDTWILDGGACDWAPFADGAAGYVGDDLEAAEDMLRLLDALMRDRRRNLQAVRGTRNGWTLGPAEDYRLQWVLVEEAPFYLDEAAVKGDKKLEAHVRACRGLLAGLLRRGRAPLFHVSLIAQKGTGTGGLPPDLRDLCGLRWSFGVATTDAAAAILGDDIRKHETMSPTLLQGPEHVGVASVLLRTGTSPYTLVKFPAIGQDRADQVAASLAARSHVAVPDDARELVS